MADRGGGYVGGTADTNRIRRLNEEREKEKKATEVETLNPKP